MDGEFTGKVALVTGAGSGIGQACALAFARRGAKLVIVDSQLDGSRETLQLIEHAGGSATFFKCNVSNSAEVDMLLQTIGRTCGRLDFACNNASVDGAPAAGCVEDVWNRAIHVNLTGIWLCMKYEIPLMLQQSGGGSSTVLARPCPVEKTGSGGVIVNIATTAGAVGSAFAPAYAASKHGLIGLTQTAAMAYAHRGLRVNAVCPSLIYTPTLFRGGILHGTAIDAEVYSLNTSSYPMKPIGTSEEVAEAVAWLCSDAAGCTGHTHAMLVEGSPMVHERVW